MILLVLAFINDGPFFTHFRYWHVLPSGLNQFETRNMGEAYAVDLDKKTCSCRLWQLNGYGCVHSVATISFLNRNPEHFVDPLYLGTFFNNTYRYPIFGMNGSNMWPTTNYTPPLPPLKRRMPGRPTVKRRRDASESSGRHTVSKRGKTITCSSCKEVGHNKSKCKSMPTSKKQRVKKMCKGSTSGGPQAGGQQERGDPEGGAPEVGAHEGGDHQGGDPEVGAHEGGDHQGGDHEGGAHEEADHEGGEEAVGAQQTGASGLQERVGQKRIRKQSERILRRKLAKRVQEKNGEGNCVETPLNVE